MAYLNFNGVGVTAMSAAVPRNIINNYEYTEYFPADQVKEVVDKVGIYERRFADTNTCSSDLCYAAAEKLIADNGINKDEIDLLIFISQTPDYRMPATSCILQHRLGLPNTCIAFDITLGCSAFIYGLSVAYSMVENSKLRKALILDGETRSKVYSPKDRRSAFLFGDGGVAALVERNEKFGDSFFSLNTDGSRANLIMIKGGGYRHPSSIETLKEKVVDEYGNIEGIITLHDLTESIFGDILEENETEEQDIVVRQDGSMLVEASMNLDDFMEAMGIMDYDDLKEEDFTTLSGLAMFLIGRVPKAGDLFDYKNLHFEIVDMDRGRVDKLLVTKEKEENDEESDDA